MLLSFWEQARSIVYLMNAIKFMESSILVRQTVTQAVSEHAADSALFTNLNPSKSSLSAVFNE